MSTITAKASTNYTQEMIDSIAARYKSEPTRATVDALATEFDKTARSIIAKLSAMGIYQKAERVTKRGEPIVKKEVYVKQIQDAIGRELPSLEKVSKADLVAMVEALVG